MNGRVQGRERRKADSAAARSGGLGAAHDPLLPLVVEGYGNVAIGALFGTNPWFLTETRFVTRSWTLPLTLSQESFSADSPDAPWGAVITAATSVERRRGPRRAIGVSVFCTS